MRRWEPVAFMFCVLVAANAARAGERPDYDSSAAAMGSGTYKTYCAVCHGKTGQGDGPLADQLRYVPPDLTGISRRNGGKYDFERVYQVIDGRKALKGHGGTDMPVWGDAFLQSREGYDERTVKEKITQIVHYLASLQREEAGR